MSEADERLELAEGISGFRWYLDPIDGGNALSSNGLLHDALLEAWHG